MATISAADCTWPLPYAVPSDKHTPRWTELNDCVGNQSRAVEGLASMATQAAAMDAFLRPKNSPASQPQLPFVQETLRPYAHLLIVAQKHLSTSPAFGTGKTQRSWTDAWNGVSHTQTAASFELAAVLYTIAACLTVQGSVGVATNTTESLKEAFQAFKDAASTLRLLRTQVATHLPDVSQTGMLLPELLEFCELLACTNSLHVLTLVALNAGKPAAITSRLCIDVADAYGTLSRMTVQLTPASASLTNIVQHARLTSLIFQARGHRIAGEQALEQQSMGVAISHLQGAQVFLNGVRPANSIPPALVQWVTTEFGLANAALAKATDRNNTVYFERVPAEAPTIAGAGKTVPVGDLRLDQVGGPSTTTTGANPFSAIVPPETASIAVRVKTTLAKQIAEKQRDVLNRRARAVQILSELGVSGILACLNEDPAASTRVPEALRQRILGMRDGAKGVNGEGKLMERLVTLVAHTHQVAESAGGLCREALQELEQERKEDDVCLEEYGNRVWRPLRPASRELPDVARLTAAVRDLEPRLAKEVTGPLAAMKATLQAQAADVSRLDWPVADLDALMPFRDSCVARETRSEVDDVATELHKVVSKVDAAAAAEDFRFAKLNTWLNSSEIVDRLVAAGEDGVDGVLDAIQAECIDDVSVIDAATKIRDQMVGTVEPLIDRLASLRSTDPIAAQVQEVCSSLEQSITQYNEAVAQINSLANTATLLLEEATACRDAARALRQARHMEADEFKTTLNREIESRMSRMSGQQPSEPVLESRRRQEELRREIDQLELARQQKLNAPPPPPAQTLPLGAPPVAGYHYPGFGDESALESQPLSTAPVAPPPPPPPPPPGPPPEDTYAAFFQ